MTPAPTQPRMPPPMDLVTFNVNSVRARLPLLVDWLRAHEPDVVCLQETKVEDLAFPREPLEDLGYNVETYGQRTYNGVAILSRQPLEDVIKGFPGDGEDAERRLIAAIVGDMILVNVYVPNGREVGHEKFRYKLAWLRRLRSFLDERYDPSEKLVLCGDFNITFDDRDVYDPEAWREKILCSTPEREALRGVMEFGLHDALRAHHQEAGIYTWWHYRGGGFRRNMGLRIDHFLVTRPALRVCEDVVVDVEARAAEGASDHAPVIATYEP